MSRDTVASKRYAKALFEVAKDLNRIAQVEQDLRSIVDVYRTNSDFRTILEHPGISPEAKKGIIATLFEGKITDAVYNTLRLLIDRRREAILPNLLNDYLKIANEALGQADAVVTTPMPLSPQEADEIASQFGAMTGKKIRVHNVIDPSLLGGLTVRIGDRLYDGSLSGKLNRLQRSLMGSKAL